MEVVAAVGAAAVFFEVEGAGVGPRAGVAAEVEGATAQAWPLVGRGWDVAEAVEVREVGAEWATGGGAAADWA